MDEFDLLLKGKARTELEVLPGSLEHKIEQTLHNLPKKKRGIRKSMIAAVIAAVLLTMPLMSVYGKEIPLVNTVIEFFKGSPILRYGGDAGVYEKYSKGIGQTITDNGVSITVDNIAADDNFLVLFYTVEGDGKKGKKIFCFDPKVGKAKEVGEVANNLHGRIKINGQDKTISNNVGAALPFPDNPVLDNYNAYLTADGKIKGMIRADISRQDLPQQFNVDFLVNEALGKMGQWNFGLHVSKEEAMKDTRVVKVNKEGYVKYPDREHKFTVEKVSFTPFGNQIIISEKLKRATGLEDQPNYFNLFALYDDKGNVLDILRPRGAASPISSGIKTENSFEFVKGNKDSKFLTLVPVRAYFDTAPKLDNNPVDIDKFPLELKMSNNGSLVIERIEFGDTETKIYYTKKGVVLLDGPPLLLIDEKSIEKTPVVSIRREFGDYVADREKGLYVSILPKLDKSNKYKLSYLTDLKFELLDQYKIEIPLE